VNEAAILAARRNKNAITMSEMQEAVERIIAGPERKSRLISAEEKKVIAYHEAGHALVGHVLPHCDPIRKVTIISRGMSLGHTMSLPEDDRVLQSRDKFRDELASMLGGRAAEVLVFDELWTGANNDLERATRQARSMITQYGMSEKLGPLTFGQKDDMVFLGRTIGEQRNYSEEIARQIDHEVRSIMREAYERARNVLVEHRAALERVASRLIEVETLDREEFKTLVAGAPAPGIELETSPA